MTDFKKLVKQYISFKEPEKDEEFLLNEKDNDNSNQQQSNNQSNAGKAEDKNISTNLFENLEYLKTRLNFPSNSDIVFREFDITVKKDSLHAFIVFFDGMIDKNILDNDILSPLMLLSNLDITDKAPDVIGYIKAHLIPHNQVTLVENFNKVIQAVNGGACGIFIDTVNIAFVADVKGMESRKVERPNIELVIRGPQEGFTETLRVNIALIRKRLKDENVIAENIEVGERGKTICSLVYIKDITNENLVNEVRRRISSIKVDYLNSSGELEQFIEDKTFVPIPQVSATERPDKAALALAEGKIAVIVDGSPFALILPVVFNDLIRSSEDYFLRFPYANILRIIRLIGVFLSLLLPGIYIAITNYHQEMIPSSLLIAIAGAREKVPFPSIVELTIMEFAFEIIREAGIRIPGPLGPTIGIIGGIILGQAAVAANIVSPILIIVVAVTGICSFSIPDYSLAFAIRYLRFVYIILGATAGFLGISTGIFIQGILLVSTKSFGVPMFAPYGPKTVKENIDNIFSPPIWKKENRPDYLNTKNPKRQAKISRGWIKQDNKGDKNEG